MKPKAEHVQLVGLLAQPNKGIAPQRQDDVHNLISGTSNDLLLVMYG